MKGSTQFDAILTILKQFEIDENLRKNSLIYLANRFLTAE